MPQNMPAAAPPTQQPESVQSPPGNGQPPQGYGQPPQGGYFPQQPKKDNKKKWLIAAVVIGALYLYGSGNNQQQQPVQQPGTQQPGTQQPGTQQPAGQPSANTQAIIKELSDSELGLQQIRQFIQNGNGSKALQVIPQLAQAIMQVVQQIPEDQMAVGLFQIQLQRCQLLQNAAQGNASALQQEMQAAAQFQQGFNTYCNGR